MNPPFDNISKFLDHYFAVKDKDPSTSGVFVLPDWTTAPWFPVVRDKMQLLQRYPKGSFLFSRPKKAAPEQRE